jgi:SAM-dependent methyltransferase
VIPRARRPEILDVSTPPREMLARVGRYLAWVNRRLGVTRSIAARIDPGATVLDVACGAGDIAEGLARAGARVVRLDRSAEMLRLGGGARIRGDALRLPLPDGAVDFVVSAHFFHHLDEGEVVRVLREFGRVARRGVAVSDLLRRRRAWLWIRLLTLAANPVVRHDGPLSVLRGFTPAEARELVRRSGLEWLAVREERAHHFTIAGRKPAGTPGPGGRARTPPPGSRPGGGCGCFLFPP